MDCKQVMDWLDEAGKTELTELKDEAIRGHIEGCKECGKYYAVSVGLKHLDAGVPEMWDLFEEKRSAVRRPPVFRKFGYALASIAASAIIVIGVIFRPFAVTTATSVTTYLYNESLEYTKELSEGKSYANNYADTLEYYYTLARY